MACARNMHISVKHAIFTHVQTIEKTTVKYHEDDCGPYYSTDESNYDEDDGEYKKEEQAEEQIHSNPQEEEYDYTDWTEEQFRAYMEKERRAFESQTGRETEQETQGQAQSQEEQEQGIGQETQETTESKTTEQRSDIARPVARDPYLHGGPNVGGIDIVPWGDRLYNKHHKVPYNLPVQQMKNLKGRGKNGKWYPLVSEVAAWVFAVACACAEASSFSDDLEIEWIYHVYTVYYFVHKCSKEGFELVWNEVSKPFTTQDYSWKLIG